MRVGQARKRDANEAVIVGVLERMGCVVFKISEPGAPDLLVGRNGQWCPLEIKHRTGRLTTRQHKRMIHAGCAPPIARSVDEAVQALQAAGVLRGVQW